MLPQKPQITTNYSALEQADPQRKLPGQRLDVDFAALADGVGKLTDVVGSVIQAEGVLQDEIVTRDALSPEMRPEFKRPVPFSPGATYARNDTIVYNGRFFVAERAIANAATPFAGADWSMIGDFRSGLVVSEDNLAGLTDLDAARAALGLGSMAVRDAGADADEFRNNGQNDQRFLRVDQNLADLADTEVARNNLGLSGAAVSNRVTDLNTPGPGLLGRAGAGEGPIERIQAAGMLSLEDVAGVPTLSARKASLAEATTGAPVDAYMNPYLARMTFNERLADLVGADLFSRGAAFLRADRMVHFRHEVGAGVTGPSITTGDWRTRPLNWIESSGIPRVALTADQFTLPGGLFYVQAVVQAHNVGRVRTRLQRVAYVDDPAYATNVLEDTVALAVSESLEGSVSSRSQMTQLTGFFSNNRLARFELQQIVSASGTAGLPSSFGGYRECYADIFIFRLGDAQESAPYAAPVYLGV